MVVAVEPVLSLSDLKAWVTSIGVQPRRFSRSMSIESDSSDTGLCPHFRQFAVRVNRLFRAPYRH